MTRLTEPGTQIPVATLPNLRDLGGWPTTNGRQVRMGVLFRSTDLGRLDEAGGETIARLKLRTVVDLRTEAERQSLPDRLPPNAISVVCDVLADSTDSAPAQLPKVMANPKDAGQILGGDKALEMFASGYREVVSLPSALTGYRQFFTTLANSERRPLLFHCSTGKDRTGWAAAVILTLLGVSEEDVMREYLLTNEQLLPALQPVLDQFQAAGGDPQLLMPVLGVRPDYLNAAFAEIKKRWGSMEAYLNDGLGLDAATHGQLRETLTEEVPS